MGVAVSCFLLFTTTTTTRSALDPTLSVPEELSMSVPTQSRSEQILVGGVRDLRVGPGGKVRVSWRHSRHRNPFDDPDDWAAGRDCAP